MSLDNERGTTIDEMVDYFEGKLKDKNAALELVWFHMKTLIKYCTGMSYAIALYVRSFACFHYYLRMNWRRVMKFSK